MVNSRSLFPLKIFLFVISILWHQVDAVKEIVAIGDSMTDSCQFGAKYVVDTALNSTQVRLVAL